MATDGLFIRLSNIDIRAEYRRAAFIDGDYQLATEMLKVTRADKLHSVDG